MVIWGRQYLQKIMLQQIGDKYKTKTSQASSQFQAKENHSKYNKGVWLKHIYFIIYLFFWGGGCFLENKEKVTERERGRPTDRQTDRQERAPIAPTFRQTLQTYFFPGSRLASPWMQQAWSMQFLSTPACDDHKNIYHCLSQNRMLSEV